MKTIGKALMGSALLMVLMLGFQGADARATTWNPYSFDLSTTIIESDRLYYYDASDNLTLEKSLTLEEYASFAVSKSFITAENLFMKNGSSIFTAGVFEASNIDLNGIGLFPPMPPRPTPGLPDELSAFKDKLSPFNDAFFNKLDYEDINYGAGIFATDQITIGALDLNFSDDYTPVHGDKFLVAATTRVGGISEEVLLTSNLKPSLFKVTYVDPKLTVGTQDYEYAYVTVSAVPEPGTLLLLGVGLLGLAGIGRKKAVC